MASLTHVSMFDKDGWRHITAEEASELHPGGTVSAHSGLFVCELCHQYVTLTDGDIRIRYFKHSRGEADKNCPERTFGTGYTSTFYPGYHELPIRIVVSPSSFTFELGLIQVPSELLDKKLCIEIKPCEKYGRAFTYDYERIKPNGTTYLSIGDYPFKKYTLTQNCSADLYKFWSKEIIGMEPDGTLFDKVSGRKLANDSDVEIKKEYYLLKKDSFYYYGSDIKSQFILEKRVNGETWRLYTVSASNFSEEAAKFFLNYRCWLTERPISIQTVYPLFIEGNYVVKHNNDDMYIAVGGNEPHLKSFPSALILRLSPKELKPALCRLNCSCRQQLISAGRKYSNPALQYTYFWKESLNCEGVSPEFSVTALSGTQIEPGEANSLPQNKTLRFKSNYDGELIVAKDDFIIDKRRVPADKYIELDSLSYGTEIRLIVGLDCVWQIHFKKPLKPDNEVEILRYITGVSGVTIPAPHSLHNILFGMKQYPEICKWIRKCIETGTINEQSYRRLQKVYLSRKGEA